MHIYFSNVSARILSVCKLRRAGAIFCSMALAFVLGVETAGDVQPLVEYTRAGGRVSGDMNGDGMVGVADARIALDIALGYRAATAAELEADVNNDLQITVQDVAAILEAVDRR